VTSPDPTLRPVAELAIALIDQWRLVLRGVQSVVDWNAPTRLDGWTAHTLLGHLVVVGEAIPRTLAEPPTDAEPTDVYAVFRGASGRAPNNDKLARDFAGSADPSSLVARLENAIDAAREILNDIDGDAVLPTRFGPFPVRHFLVHRIVEGVVHGLDLPTPVTPDPAALDVCAEALTQLLFRTSPELVAHVPVDQIVWVQAATGRAPAPAELRDVLPLLR
jgi:uncharacterized protein (TIGR03083 family)